MADERPGGEPSEAPESRPGVRYSRWVGLAFLILIGIATLNTVRTQDDGILGADQAQTGEPLASFAVPDMRGSRDGDANIAQDDCESAQNPCPSARRRTPACRVPGPGVIRVCDFFEKPFLLSFWFTRGADCLPAQDAIDRLARRYRDRISVLSLNIRDDRAEVERIMRERGWQMPVGHDRDGAVSNIYRVGLCPTVAFAYPGGILAFARVGATELAPAKIERDIERLLRATARREGRA